ncbi:hypothetical protein GCM10009765_79860 [Fodinicola feengrottensis]|uniref:BON domain-containing protein n=1 Tax=Fodinicola feengrottensis TaxID=435914 RepID=A0ABN2J7E8_9ACTN
MEDFLRGDVTAEEIAAALIGIFTGGVSCAVHCQIHENLFVVLRGSAHPSRTSAQAFHRARKACEDPIRNVTVYSHE